MNITDEHLIIIFNTILLLVIIFFVIRYFFKLFLKSKLFQLRKNRIDFIENTFQKVINPITVIRGYAELIKDENKLSKNGKENLEKIIINSDRLDLIVKDLVLINKLDQNLVNFNFKTSDVVSLIYEVFDNLKNKIKLDLIVDSNAKINTDPIYFKKMITRLIEFLFKEILYKGSFKLKVERKGSDIFIIFIDHKDDFSVDQNNSDIGLQLAHKISRKIGGKIIENKIKFSIVFD